ncbi:MAG: hypothetical protein H6706_24095 [Myxococcales bacterium]|nr:hypothetical protein [Myxococcales bacterium]
MSARLALVLGLALGLAGLAQARPKRRPAPPPPAEAPASVAPAAPATTAETAPSLRRSNRLEFDARLVQGEKASGAVYLFQRAPRALPGLVHLQARYLDRIVEPVLGRPADAPPAAP